MMYLGNGKKLGIGRAYNREKSHIKSEKVRGTMILVCKTRSWGL